jgi:hypothetical protein
VLKTAWWSIPFAPIKSRSKHSCGKNQHLGEWMFLFNRYFLAQDKGFAILKEGDHVTPSRLSY